MIDLDDGDRVFVSTGNAYVNYEKTAVLTFGEYPGQAFNARVVRTAKYIDPVSRTLLVEVDYDNHDALLTPESYAKVHFVVKPSLTTLIVPPSVLMFRAEGLRIATVVNSTSGDPVAKLLPVTLGGDDGNAVQVIGGLDASACVIQNPPDSLIDGDPARVVQRQADPASGKPTGGNTVKNLRALARPAAAALLWSPLLVLQPRFARAWSVRTMYVRRRRFQRITKPRFRHLPRPAAGALEAGGARWHISPGQIGGNCTAMLS